MEKIISKNLKNTLLITDGLTEDEINEIEEIYKLKLPNKFINFY